MLKLAELKMLLASHGLKPHKRRGQNFLLDPNLLRAIVRDAGVDAADCVLEIGTGCGALTLALCEEAGLVISVEVDRGMFGVAGDVLAQATNLVLLQADALQGEMLNNELTGLLHAYVETGLLAVESAEFEQAFVQLGERKKAPRLGRLKCVSNLPYSHAGPILMALLESPLPLEKLLVMVQWEVGEKLCARPGNEAYGILSLLTRQFADTRILRRVPSAVFWPRPKVDSALVEFTPRARPDMEAYARLRRLAHLLFTHRRKQGPNALSLALDTGPIRAAGWIADAGGEANQRPDELPIEVLQKLADHPDIAALALARTQLSDAQLEERAARARRRAQWKRPRSSEEEE